MSDFIHNLKKINLSSARLNESICNSNSSISNIKNSNNYIKGYKILNKESSFRAFLMGVLMLVATFISLYFALEERTWGKGILSFIVCWVISACVIDYGISPIISWIESMRPSVKFYKNLLVELEVEADFWNLDIDFDKLSPETDLKDLGFDESDITMIIYRADDDLGDIITLDELAEIKTLKNICDLAKSKEQI